MVVAGVGTCRRRGLQAWIEPDRGTEPNVETMVDGGGLQCSHMPWLLAHAEMSVQRVRGVVPWIMMLLIHVEFIAGQQYVQLTRRYNTYVLLWLLQGYRQPGWLSGFFTR